jgi:chromosome segregation ATPase
LNPQDEAVRLVGEITDLKRSAQEMRESWDGFEKMFRDTVETLRTLVSSHKLTKDSLAERKIELNEVNNVLVSVQAKKSESDRALSSAKKSLRESQQRVKDLSEELEITKQNHATSQKNCDKLKTSLEKAKEALKFATAAVSTLLDVCVPEAEASRSVDDRLATIAEDVKAQSRGKLKLALKQGLTVLKVTNPELKLSDLIKTDTITLDEPTVAGYTAEVEAVVDQIVRELDV